jgi:hypothetical protein
VTTWKQTLRWNRKAEIAFNAWEKFKATQPGLTDEHLESQGFIKPQAPTMAGQGRRMTKITMPPIPDPFCDAIELSLADTFFVYTADQMRAYGKACANAALDAATQAVAQHNKTGRQWINGSLWDGLTREASERIRALKGSAQ